MNGCAGNSSLCDGRDLLPVRVWPRRPVAMCGQCRRVALEMGAKLVERRTADLPVLHDRRHSVRPAWLSRLTARDETGRMAA